jgi:RNase P/RNase MRP subunit p29
MHNDDVEAASMLDRWRKDPAHKNVSVPGDDRSPAFTWQTYLYGDSGKVVMPSANLMVCLRQAGAKMTLKRQTTFKAITQSGLLTASDCLEFRCGGKELALSPLESIREKPFDVHKQTAATHGFELLVKRALVGTKKHVRVRPMFRSWEVRGEIMILAPEISFSNLETLFGLAGSVGMGDWRPGGKTPGSFGMFTATLKEV